MIRLANSTAYIAGLALVTLVGAIVLLALGKTVPVELWGALTLLLGGGLGIAQPTPSTTPTPVAPTPAPAGPVASPGVQ
jgi:hypothetical protein